ncbi:biogenesis of lysosome-related organelles complex 1 subunit 5-like [Xenia sp. Carnegie-2017]|uniref:biogenesis of lysosome-related organelles complex 1 subunit 5-like n=1 Tax=Xenia sp. Carnegie-2017 TaxID=2897299 RepID=UPI001F04CA7E|nr:biogenesis of lysosome-related organelles complex 1 subunit 5-like [Xenia sp. Carnegie-2017]
MAAEKLVRDVADVYIKLFNHRGPIQREVNFYVQEFESKRKDREHSRLNQANVHSCHIESLLPDVEDLSREHVQCVVDRTKDAVKKVNAILASKLPEENIERVEERRTRMEKEWKLFEEKTKTALDKIERDHNERMKQLEANIKRLDNEINSK